MEDSHNGLGEKLLFAFGVFVLMVMQVACLLTGGLQTSMAMIAQITAGMVIQSLVIVALVLGVYCALTRLHPFFDWSWASLIGKSPINIGLIPIKVKYLGLVFLILLILNLPTYALVEEEIFRAGTDNWVEGIWRSLLFGLAHCLSGISLGAGLAVSVTGLWLTHCYFVGGVQYAALHHTTYNIILIAALFLLLVYDHITDLRKGSADN